MRHPVQSLLWKEVVWSVLFGAAETSILIKEGFNEVTGECLLIEDLSEENAVQEEDVSQEEEIQ